MFCKLFHALETISGFTNDFWDHGSDWKRDRNFVAFLQAKLIELLNMAATPHVIDILTLWYLVYLLPTCNHPKVGTVTKRLS